MDRSLTPGIRRRYLIWTFSILLFLLTAGAASFMYMKQSQDALNSERELLYEKQVQLEELRDALSDMFFRARGYMALQDEGELNQVYAEIEEVRASLEVLKNYNLTEEEETAISELTDFMDRYEKQTLPEITSRVQQQDYEGVRELAKNGLTADVNAFMAYAKQSKNEVDEELENLYADTLQQANLLTFWTILFILVLFMFIAYFIWRMMNEIVKPLEQLKTAVDGFTAGESVPLLPVNRKDEIGVLFSSFGLMVRTIQEKEEELMAQNEELVMQQDELQEHQEKIEESLKETNEAKGRLEKYNELNHVLSFSLNKQELVESILAYLNGIYQLDASFFWLQDSGEKAMKGITASMFQDFQVNRKAYVNRRLNEELFFTLKREAAYEKGLAAEPVYVHDYFSAVRNPAGEAIALFGGSRIGRSFSDEEQTDLLGLLNRIYLAIERIQLYDRNVQERILNERIVNNINEGIQFIGATGAMIRRNDAFCSLSAYTNPSFAEEVEKNEWISQLAARTEEPEQLKAFLEACVSEQQEDVREYRYKTSGAPQRVIDVYSAPVLIDGEKTGTILVHRDITKEDEVDRMKTELVSTVSHELRTPLSSVLGFTELLLNKQLKPEKQKKYLETIYKEAKRLTNLINDFLDLQRMEAGSQVYRMEELMMNELAVEVVGRFRVKSSHPFIVMDEAAGVKIEGDRERMTQVLTNVIGNAVKFSPDGGPVTLSLSNEKDHVVLCVRDEGIGIPSEDIPKLFNKFQRIDNSARRKIGGTGLGLAICREIVEKHGGTIGIDSEEGAGTAVRISLPLAAASNFAFIETKEDAPAIMIVEDDISLALLLSEELKMNGFKVIYHISPADAFEEAKRTPLVGAVIDIMLGDDLDGWDLVKMLKEEEATRHIPVIISSALDPTEEPKKVDQIAHYLTKPYPPNQLTKAILDFFKEPAQPGVIFYPEERSQ